MVVIVMVPSSGVPDSLICSYMYNTTTLMVQMVHKRWPTLYQGKGLRIGVRVCAVVRLYLHGGHTNYFHICYVNVHLAGVVTA